MSPKRTYLTLVGCVLAIIAAGQLRPENPVLGMNSEVFYYKKMLWQGQFDVAVGGDSRVLVGVSAKRLGETLGNGRRVANFGFHMVGYTRMYLKHLAGVLDPASKRPTLVLGVDPHSLTPNAARDIDDPASFKTPHPWRPDHYNLELASEFGYLAGLNPTEIRLRITMQPFFDYFSRFHPRDLTAWMRGKKIPMRSRFHEDGWFEMEFRPSEHHKMQGALGGIYEGNTVSPRVIGRLLEEVASLRKRGVTVYGYNPPVEEFLRKNELARSLFDEEGFARAFERAGGRWLRLPERPRLTFDGHHLLTKDALATSEELGRAILQAEAASPR